MSNRVTQADIVTLYRGLLSREPEESAIANYIDNQIEKQVLIENIIASDEFKNRLQSINREDALKKRYTPSFIGRYYNKIDLSASSSQLKTIEQSVRSVWTKLGEEEPHWSVATLPQYRADQMTPEAEEAFYASGRPEVEELLHACACNGIALPRHGLVLDLGCGLGRLGEHLSSVFETYLGTDISAKHLAAARGRFERLGRTNARFELLPDLLAGSQTFDCLFSLIVLQHNPPPIIAQVLDAMLGRLNPGGIGFFQIPSYIEGYTFEVGSYLDGIAGGSGMEMHVLPQNQVFAICDANACVPIDVVVDARIGPIGVSNTYFVQKKR
ncbi:class I SAM-dependent methyltransferase [uncultured Methylobacterium sp.]|uniref:class I SAM-dependent methyltransferase n=1 Tax=uncultured Methylobacterium sp. TaxID=157278 RepID=UPI0035C97A4C